MANKKDDLDFEQRSMAGLLAKFRIEYSALKLLPDITKKAKDSTYKFFDDLIQEFKANEEDEGKILVPAQVHSFFNFLLLSLQVQLPTLS